MSYTRVQSHENVLFGLYMMSSIFHPQHSPALLIAVMFDDKKKKQIDIQINHWSQVEFTGLKEIVTAAPLIYRV